MVIDRSTTAGLLMILGSLFPQYLIIFQFLIGLDISSHYMQMYAAVSAGTSHKTSGGNFILRLYYESKTVLFLVCALDQLFFVGCYLLYFYQTSFVIFLTLISFPVCAFKQFVNCVQFVNAAKQLNSTEKTKKQ